MKSSRNKTSKRTKNRKNNEFTFRTFDDDSTANETIEKITEQTPPTEEQLAEQQKQLKARKAAKRAGFEFKSFGSEIDQQLWQACKNNDLLKAEELLKEGANPEFKPSPNDLSALDYATIHQNGELAYYLIDEGGADFTKSKKFLDDANIKNAVLLLACENYQIDNLELRELINELLNLGATPNDFTLGVAINKKDMNLIHQLCAHGAPIDMDDFMKIAALESEQKEQPHVTELFKDIRRMVKEPMAEAKNRIMAGASQLRFFDNTSTVTINDNDIRIALENPIDTIANKIYHENTDQQKPLVEHLKQTVQQDTILTPLLKLIALASLGIHNNPANKKPLKTIITTKQHVGELAVTGETALGIYPAKNTVFIGSQYLQSKDGQSKQINLPLQVGTVLHEWKHFCDNELFGNSLMTASADDQEKYATIFEKTKQQINNYHPDNKNMNPIKDSFLAAFYSHHEKQQPVELLARVPETLGVLGLEKGYEWLKTNTPDLLNFYETRYNQYINNYLDKQQQLLLHGSPNKHQPT